MTIPPLVEPGAELSAAASVRTIRQRGLPPLTAIDRRRLANARVLVLGAGRLGSPAVRNLAAAGVGTIGIVAADDIEPDARPEAEGAAFTPVSAHALPPFTPVSAPALPALAPVPALASAATFAPASAHTSAAEVTTGRAGEVAPAAGPSRRSGRHAAEPATDARAESPADAAADDMAELAAELAPESAIVRHPGRLSPDNAFEILGGYDLVIDAADHFPAPFLANDTCSALGLPLVWASVVHGDAQLSVFWAHPPAGSDVTGVHLRDLYRGPPAPGERPVFPDADVLGALCGQLGSLMAGEAIKLITGVAEPLIGRRLVIDALSGQFTETPLLGTGVPAACPMPVAAGVASAPADWPAISAAELVERMTARAAGTEALLVVDVREPGEHAESAVPGSLLLPLDRILTVEGQADLPRDVPLVLHCHRGTRADRAAASLRDAGFTDVSVLSGGIVAWDDAVADGTAPGRGSTWADTLSAQAAPAQG